MPDWAFSQFQAKNKVKKCPTQCPTFPTGRRPAPVNFEKCPECPTFYRNAWNARQNIFFRKNARLMPDISNFFSKKCLKIPDYKRFKKYLTHILVYIVFFRKKYSGFFSESIKIFTTITKITENVLLNGHFFLKCLILPDFLPHFFFKLLENAGEMPDF